MSKISKPRSVQVTKEGLEKVLQRMAELEKPGNPDKKGWSQPDLVDRSGASIDTVKRFLGKKRVDRQSIILITTALGLKPTDVVNPNEWEPSAIDWEQVCRNNLNRQKSLTIDLLTGGDGLPFHELDFVPLGLLGRHEQDERGSNRDYKVTETFDQQEEFFEQVLRTGQKSRNSQGRRLAIIGESGAGKTTLLLKIGFWVLKETDEVPIWVDLKRVGTKSLLQYLQEDWLREVSGKLGDIPSEWIADLEQRLESGRVCLLLDGLEKLGTIFDRHLTGWEKKARTVLNCRTSVWNADKNALEAFGFDTYKNLGFSPEQVKQFINGWFNSNAEQLWAELDQPRHHRIKDLVKNPLYLTFLCRTWQPQRKLPNTKAGLIQWFLEKDSQPHDNDSPTPIQKQRLIEALGRLALEALKQDQSSLSLSLIYNKLGEYAEFLFQLADKLGWLKRVSEHEAVYDFLHDSFKEYFAAKAIPELEKWQYFMNQEKGIYRIFEQQWKEVILLWLGRPEEEVPREQKDAFIKALVEFKDGCGGFYEYRAYFLAAAGAAEFEHCSQGSDIVEQLIKWSFGYLDEQQERWEFHAFIAEGARVALRETNRNKAINALLPLLDRSEHQEIRHAVIESLGEIGASNPDTINALNSILDSSSENTYCIAIAACSLGKITTGELKRKAIDRLIKILVNDPCERTTAARLLKDCAKNDSWAIKALEKCLNNINKISLEHLIDSTLDHNNLDSEIWILAYTLLEIDPRNYRSEENTTNILKAATAHLIDTLKCWNSHILTDDFRTLGLGIEFSPEKLDSEIINIIPVLNNLWRNNQEQETYEKAAQCLKAILLGKQFSFSTRTELFPLVIVGLKDCPVDRIYQNYELLWHCAQNMTYQEFYKAWHG